MGNSFSGKGKAWEWKHSLWMLWTLPLFGWTSFISFIYIGRKTKTKRWLIFGIIYLSWILFQWFILPMFPSDSLIGSFSTASYTVSLIIWIWSIIHSFLVRKEYLTRLAYLVDHPEIGENSKKEYYNAVTQDYQRLSQNNSIPKVITMPKREAENKTNTTQAQNAVQHQTETDNNLGININSCSHEELLALPGITMPIAKKIMDRRNNEGDFTSIDEFMDFIMVKPHFAIQLREIVTVSATSSTKSKTASKRNMDF